ncbi:hypothetical protein AAFF_G00223120 [Aldrovandia affinis]|uniref:Uncharacterized protein n=1 Tax=Aldrovandia affinis TaxID=143900 RepID=A0AAD7RFZ2_9TELE|nr:hypothetical protein AAFF_G00223120 [Aldrovandia affinis]
MFAHIAYSVQHHHKRAVVVATDTDVIMMCIYYIAHMDGLEELWVKKMDIYLPAHAITDALAVKYGDPGESLDVKEDVVTAARQYMVSLYERSDFSGNLDALRAHRFGNIKGDMRYLPPTEDAF